MDIRSINSRSYLDPTSRARKTEGANAPNTDTTVRSNAGVQDTVSIGGNKPTEFNYALNLLQNANRASLSDLREVKQKIDQGAYDTVEVNNKISSKLSNDLSVLESAEISDQLRTADNETKVSELDQSTKERLTQSDDVLNTISDRILKELFRF